MLHDTDQSVLETGVLYIKASAGWLIPSWTKRGQLRFSLITHHWYCDFVIKNKTHMERIGIQNNYATKLMCWSSLIHIASIEVASPRHDRWRGATPTQAKCIKLDLANVAHLHIHHTSAYTHRYSFRNSHCYSLIIGELQGWYISDILIGPNFDSCVSQHTPQNQISLQKITWNVKFVYSNTVFEKLCIDNKYNKIKSIRLKV